MKVFISWSGERSKAVAEALREWIPSVIQAVKPWMSKEDISKGARWSRELAENLKDTNFGVVCLTADNLKSSWILFEAGALSKAIENAFVCPYLVDLEVSALDGPWKEFQATKAQKDDTLKLMRDMNKALAENSPDQALSEEQLKSSFEVWWPKLEKRLKDIPSSSTPVKKRSNEEMLEEILTLVRGLARRPSPPELPGFARLTGLARLTDEPPRMPLTLQEYLRDSPRLPADLRLSDLLTDVSSRSPAEISDEELKNIEEALAKQQGKKDEEK